jgi:hypothetical protein
MLVDDKPIGVALSRNLGRSTTVPDEASEASGRRTRGVGGRGKL